MFTIKSNYDEKISIKNTLEKVRAFFTDTKNFVELMIGVESIIALSDTLHRWTIRVDFPIIGTIKQEFLVEKTEDSDDTIEWTPAQGEMQNLLKYSADFQPISENETMVRLMQMVELRREKASQLHFLAGMAGEAAISKEMGNHIGKMLNIFLQTAKTRLES
jgi:carbon monoxide dehydrogenase subunit G